MSFYGSHLFPVVLVLTPFSLRAFRPICLNAITQVWNLTLGMLASDDHPALGAKAAESYGLLLFVEWLMDSLTVWALKKNKELHS